MVEEDVHLLAALPCSSPLFSFEDKVWKTFLETQLPKKSVASDVLERLIFFRLLQDLDEAVTKGILEEKTKRNFVALLVINYAIILRASSPSSSAWIKEGSKATVHLKVQKVIQQFTMSIVKNQDFPRDLVPDSIVEIIQANDLPFANFIEAKIKKLARKAQGQEIQEVIQPQQKKIKVDVPPESFLQNLFRRR